MEVELVMIVPTVVVLRQTPQHSAGSYVNLMTA